MTIPGDAANGFTLVALAFGKGAEPVLAEWMEPAYLRFVAKHGLFAGSYQCTAWFIPVFVGLNKAAYEPSMKKLRNSASNSAWRSCGGASVASAAWRISSMERGPSSVTPCMKAMVCSAATGNPKRLRCLAKPAKGRAARGSSRDDVTPSPFRGCGRVLD